MILESHDGLRRPAVQHATRVLITSDDGTPLVLVFEDPAGPGRAHYRIHRAGDGDFAEQLRASGVDRTVVVQTLALAPR